MKTPDQTCVRCGIVLPRTKLGGFAWCRGCFSSKRMARYWSDPAYREKTKAYHRKNERRKRADPDQNERMLAKLRKKYAENEWVRDRAKAYAGKYRRECFGREITNQARKRANRDGREFSLDANRVQEMWDASHACAYCGVEMVVGTGRWANESASLDRVDPNAGYTEQNTVIACWRCNSLKRDATPDELEALVKNFRRVMAERGIL